MRATALLWRGHQSRMASLGQHMCNKPTLDLLGSLLNWHGMPDCANSIDNIPWGTQCPLSGCVCVRAFLSVFWGGGKGAQPMLFIIIPRSHIL